MINNDIWLQAKQLNVGLFELQLRSVSTGCHSSNRINALWLTKQAPISHRECTLVIQLKQDDHYYNMCYLMFVLMSHSNGNS